MGVVDRVGIFPPYLFYLLPSSNSSGQFSSFSTLASRENQTAEKT